VEKKEGKIFYFRIKKKERPPFFQRKVLGGGVKEEKAEPLNSGLLRGEKKKRGKRLPRTEKQGKLNSL